MCWNHKRHKHPSITTKMTTMTMTMMMVLLTLSCMQTHIRDKPLTGTQCANSYANCQSWLRLYYFISPFLFCTNAFIANIRLFHAQWPLLNANSSSFSGKNTLRMFTKWNNHITNQERKFFELLTLTKEERIRWTENGIGKECQIGSWEKGNQRKNARENWEEKWSDFEERRILIGNWHSKVAFIWIMLNSK